MKRDVMRLSLFMRKPVAGQHHSVERLFDAVVATLPPGQFEVRRLVCPFESRGVMRRVLNMIWAALNQGDVNHITGDVNYLGLLMHRARTVLTILDSGSMRRLKGLKRWLYRWLWIRLPIYRAARVTVISEAILDETLQFSRAAAGKTTVVSCCVTGNMQVEGRAFNSEQPRILQVGTRENKNLPRVIEALADIRCTLVIIGPLSGEQKRLLEGAGLKYENRANLADAEMGREYALADIVLFASTYEGFGLPILEAQTVGRAVVTSTRPPMDAVAGRGAALVNPDDPLAIRAAVSKIIEDEAYRNGLIAAGYENVERYAPQQVAAQYARIYADLSAQEARS